MTEVDTTETAELQEDQNGEASENTEDTAAEADTTSDDTGAEQEDYRGKLNATNHFLKKEGYEFKDGKWQKKPAASTEKKPDAPSKEENALSQKDMYALMRANVPEEDVDTVVKYAKLEGITISEALKASVVKTILSEKAEERNTSRATNVQGGARGSSKVSTEKLLADARKGIMPDNDADLERLLEAQMEQKRSRK